MQREKEKERHAESAGPSLRWPLSVLGFASGTGM